MPPPSVSLPHAYLLFCILVLFWRPLPDAINILEDYLTSRMVNSAYVFLRTSQCYPAGWHQLGGTVRRRAGKRCGSVESLPIQWNIPLKGAIRSLVHPLFSFITSWSPCSQHGVAHSHHHDASLQASEQQGPASTHGHS